MTVRNEKYRGWISFDLVRKDGSIAECMISDRTMVALFAAESAEGRHVIGAFHQRRAGVEAYAESEIAKSGTARSYIVLDD
jgi:hypothetical protein